MKTQTLGLLVSVGMLFGCSGKAGSPQSGPPGSTGGAAVKAIPADSTHADQSRLAVSLEDGTKLIGESNRQAFTIQTPYMKTEIPVDYLVSMERDPQTKAFTAILANGDRIQGTLSFDALELETIVGKISVPIEKVTSIAALRQSSAPTDGLAAFYSLEGDTKDRSGHGRDGTLHGAVPAAGHDGRAFSGYAFDGGDTYVQLPSVLFSASDAGVTISAWVLAKDISRRGMVVFTGTHMGELQMQVGDGNFQFLAKTMDGNWHAAQAPAVAEKFVQLVGVYRRGTSIQLWINGERKSETPVPELALYHGQPPASAAIGAYWPENMNFVWGGVIDDVRFYNRSLSEAEIAALYAAEK